MQKKTALSFSQNRFISSGIVPSGAVNANDAAPPGTGHGKNLYKALYKIITVVALARLCTCFIRITDKRISGSGGGCNISFCNIQAKEFLSIFAPLVSMFTKSKILLK